MDIRPATAEDRPAIWSVLEPIIREGETYALDRDMTGAAALAYWAAADREVFVAEAEGCILGTYFLRANQAGGGLRRHRQRPPPSLGRHAARRKML